MSEVDVTWGEAPDLQRLRDVLDPLPPGTETFTIMDGEIVMYGKDGREVARCRFVAS